MQSVSPLFLLLVPPPSVSLLMLSSWPFFDSYFFASSYHFYVLCLVSFPFEFCSPLSSPTFFFYFTFSSSSFLFLFIFRLSTCPPPAVFLSTLIFSLCHLPFIQISFPSFFTRSYCWSWTCNQISLIWLDKFYWTFTYLLLSESEVVPRIFTIKC